MKRQCLSLCLALVGCAPSMPQAARPAPGDVTVARDVEFEVAAPRGAFVQAFLGEPLETFLPGTAKLPGVHHTEALTDLAYPAVGSVRLVVLKDGQSAHEEVLECDQRHLKYLVTQYTSKAAGPVEYGVGEFTFGDEGPKTRVHWRYLFKLRSNRFPGYLGPVGRFLFRSQFLDSDYADFMVSGAASIQAFGAKVRVPKHDGRPPMAQHQ